jgi:hypothetical protein
MPKLLLESQELLKQRKDIDYSDLEKKVLKTHVLRITPEMRDKVIKEGMASMYKGGIVNKVKSMDKPIQGNRREM